MNREKDAKTRDFLEVAKSCIKICRAHGVPLLINDRIDIALACNADGVHVGQSDIPAHEVRRLLGPTRSSVSHARQRSKRNRHGLMVQITLVVAIGGINHTNAAAVMGIGIPNLKGVAVVSALFDRQCVLEEASKLHATLVEATT
ncbi:hypothetical protein Csa_018831 [Cucumis sativus]|nr:hypothetical protein Csa_018831 [Cucumis sativus]